MSRLSCTRLTAQCARYRARDRARGAALGAALLFPLAASGLAGCGLAERELTWVDRTAVPVERVAGDSLPVDAAARAALGRVLAAMPASRLERPAGAPLPVVEVPPAPDQSLGADAEPADARRCVGTVQVVRTQRGEVAAWWSRREGKRVHLLAAWRDTGRPTWRGPIPVDTLDQGSGDARDVPRGVPTGCDRPAPGLSVDGENGYVHVAYALVGPEGPGFFYAHQMDPRAAFEPPQPIVYGERLGPARVASDGDLVAVAYEDPNSGTRRRIAVALSRTAGHLWEGRITASTGLNLASDPFVAVRGGALVVGWSEVPPTGGDATFLVRRATIR